MNIIYICMVDIHNNYKLIKFYIYCLTHKLINNASSTYAKSALIKYITGLYNIYIAKGLKTTLFLYLILKSFLLFY